MRIPYLDMLIKSATESFITYGIKRMKKAAVVFGKSKNKPKTGREGHREIRKRNPSFCFLKEFKVPTFEPEPRVQRKLAHT